MKVWRKFLNMLCTEHNMLRNKLGKWIKKDPTREHEMMADNEAVYVNKGGKIKKHVIIQRERRRIIFEPVGKEEAEIPEHAYPTDSMEEWTAMTVEKTRASYPRKRIIEICDAKIEIDKDDWPLLRKTEVIEEEELYEAIKKEKD